MTEKPTRWKTVRRKALLVLVTHLIASFSGGVVGAVIWFDLLHCDHPLKTMCLSLLWSPLGVGEMFSIKPYVTGPILAGVFIMMILSVIRFWRTAKKWPLLGYALPMFIFSVRGARVLSQILAM
jgi:hypothetical protein